MPRPNNTEADTDYQEQQRAVERKADSEYQFKNEIWNNLLRQYLKCNYSGHDCGSCLEKCEALQKFMDMKDES